MWVRIGSFCLVVGLFIYILYNTGIPTLFLQGDFDALRRVANDNLPLMLLMTMGAMVLINAATIFPLLLVVSANIAVFGLVPGVLWSWLTSVLGAVVIFLCVRFWFQPFFIAKLSGNIMKKIEDKGYVFIFLGRIFPFAPTNVINIAAGVSSIRFKHFVFSTLAGNFIYISFAGVLAAGLMSVKPENAALAVTIVVLSIIIIAYRIRKRRKATGGGNRDHNESD